MLISCFLETKFLELYLNNYGFWILLNRITTCGASSLEFNFPDGQSVLNFTRTSFWKQYQVFLLLWINFAWGNYKQHFYFLLSAYHPSPTKLRLARRCTCVLLHNFSFLLQFYDIWPFYPNFSGTFSSFLGELFSGRVTKIYTRRGTLRMQFPWA